ncbi:site-specific integrase [Gabonibacter chumensis]|uniref:site-specific integrase n=1 Tax=Gabonibacter chumensis TaxID=2972474 RepID=UPI0025735A94|nr:site-specific integrase [Gabonibacter chumensis]MCR9012147.1 site-specific integrase [Gabonibacter chumensis]
MQRRNSFSVLFFIKKAKLLKNGEASVCMRITVNGQRVETNIRKSIDPASWNQAKECARGKGRQACELNRYIEESRIKLHHIFNELEAEGKPINARIMQQMFYGIGKEVEKPRMIIETFQEHNDQCRALVGKDYALITVRRYESCKRYLQELIRIKHGEEDIPISSINGELVRSFEFYLKTEKACQQNTVIRYMKCFKKIINLALANEWIEKNPFAGIKFQEKEVVREFLTMDELISIYQKDFDLERIALVRDVFIFAAFTGLAFIDVQQLSAEHIVQDNNGHYWIRKSRQKTNNMCNIPLLDIPLAILNKYASHPTYIKKGVLLPVPCNQKMNSYLKEIADLCGIQKHLTTHTARHSYATSVCLANGVSIENIAKMLGHSNIKMTQHYAKVLDSSILKDMMNVKSAIVNLV